MKQVAGILAALVAILALIWGVFLFGQEQGRAGIEAAIEAERLERQALVTQLERDVARQGDRIAALRARLGDAEQELQDAVDLGGACRPEPDELRALERRWGP